MKTRTLMLSLVLLGCEAEPETEARAAPVNGADEGERDAHVPVIARIDAAASVAVAVKDAAPPDASVVDAAQQPATPVDAGLNTTGLDCYELRAHGGDYASRYKVGEAYDAYTAFTFKAPWEGTVYGVTIESMIDNPDVVHHFLLFQDDPPGTPGPGVVQLGIHPTSALLNAWVPGSGDIDLRTRGDDIAFELPASNTYTLEMHYNSADKDAEDRSGTRICVRKDKPKNIASVSWLGTENWTVPSTKWSGTCKPNSKEPIHVLSILPHMHLKGRHARLWVERANGTTEPLHDAAFSFALERIYETNLTLLPGDAIKTECTYSEPKTYGPRVQDEMCYVFTLAYPKYALTTPDILGGGAFIHGGTSCFGN